MLAAPRFFCSRGDFRRKMLEHVESIEEDVVSGAETESFKSATQELDYSTDSFVTAGDAEGNSCTSSMRRDNDGCSQYDHNTNLADIGKPSFIFAASSATLPGLQHQCLFKEETWNQSWTCLTCLHSNCQNFAGFFSIFFVFS
ncbi:hypothetical protein F511_40393 [Dorcoceras hygrometricum]|uniref:Uncharacterized protein n=1 Tax=Dorcoceras hygrometricum TaxID=472368 RepID=A0A2Z7BSS1_9LAMI|nr:hypothetical protein F511_40393 [Dorcoceras hygrometricum]